MLTKEQYEKETGRLRKIHNEALDRIRDLTQEYLKDNRLLNDGDRVKVTIPERRVYNTVVPEKVSYAYVERAYVNYNNEVAYYYLKEKKDGTPSKFRLNTWDLRDAVIEKAE